ncbi:hypothetical protein EVAR_65784_1 [Eumeta japonica]|uniref:Uncharacterized protein n=1 Tax=Eumeta variegata TaxID=151549 RepID=A0A4C2A6S2_EUMVA|nr:hypothetical protein EVAR_65784_1 [Eumeta japonica]
MGAQRSIRTPANVKSAVRHFAMRGRRRHAIGAQRRQVRPGHTPSRPLRPDGTASAGAIGSRHTAMNSCQCKFATVRMDHRSGARRVRIWPPSPPPRFFTGQTSSRVTKVGGHCGAWTLTIPEDIRGVTSALLASWVGIGYQMEREGATASLTHKTNCNSRSCYFTSIFCERVVSHRSARPIFVLHSLLGHSTALTLPVTAAQPLSLNVTITKKYMPI